MLSVKIDSIFAKNPNQCLGELSALLSLAKPKLSLFGDNLITLPQEEGDYSLGKLWSRINDLVLDNFEVSWRDTFSRKIPLSLEGRQNAFRCYQKLSELSKIEADNSFTKTIRKISHYLSYLSFDPHGSFNNPGIRAKETLSAFLKSEWEELDTTELHLQPNDMDLKLGYTLLSDDSFFLNLKKRVPKVDLAGEKATTNAPDEKAEDVAEKPLAVEKAAVSTPLSKSKSCLAFLKALPCAAADASPALAASLGFSAIGIWILKATAVKCAGLALVIFGSLLGAVFITFTIGGAGYMAFAYEEQTLSTQTNSP